MQTKRPYRNFKQYGIDTKTYDLILKMQNYQCLICSIFHEDSKYKRLSVDHCHETGRVRGLICRRCNWAIGHMKDDPKIAQGAYFYLYRHAQRRGGLL